MELQSRIFDKKSGGRDFGEKGVKNEVFRDFLGNGSLDFVFFRTEGRYYIITYVYQATSPGKIWFSRYGAKRGQTGVKIGFFVIFSKTVEPIWFHLLEKEDIIILHMCAKL